MGHRFRQLRCLSSGETVDAHSVAIVLQLRLSAYRGLGAPHCACRVGPPTTPPGLGAPDYASRAGRPHQYATVIWLRTCVGVSNSLTNASA